MLRMRDELTERCLAQRLGFDQSSISRWRERGGRPRPNLAKQLSDYFRVTVEELFDDDLELPAEVSSTPLAMEKSLSSSAHFATERPVERSPKRAFSSTEQLNPEQVAQLADSVRRDLSQVPLAEHQAEIVATLQNLQELISTQSQQIADLTAYP